MDEAAQEEPPQQLRIREVMAKSILNASQISGVAYAINPYVGCQHGCVYCVHPSTRVLTNKGFIEISRLAHQTPQPSVVTHRGRSRRIEHVFQHLYDGKIRRIGLRYFEELRVTANHRILAIKRQDLICPANGVSLCFPNRSLNDAELGRTVTRRCGACSRRRRLQPHLIEAGTLERGDLVIAPIPRESFDVDTIRVDDVLAGGTSLTLQPSTAPARMGNRGLGELNENENGSAATAIVGTRQELASQTAAVEVVDEGFARFRRGKTRIPNLINVDKEFMRLSGYYVAEGCVSTSSSRPNSAYLTFSFNEKETMFVEDVVQLLRSLFGIRATLVPTATKSIHVCSGSTVLARVFEKLFGTRSENMQVPAWFLFLPLVKQREFLRGLLRGDGSIRPNKPRPTTLVTTSPGIRDAARLMLLRLGIPSAVSVSRTGSKRKHTAFVLFPAGTCRQKFVDLFGLAKSITEGRNLYVGITPEFIIVPIKEVQDENYTGPVYNLQVEQDHSYTASYAAVSNCYARFMSRHTGHMGEEWGSFVDVKINAARVLQQQLRQRRQAVQGTVMLSSVTDAYQPLERRFGVTRACLELLRNYQVPVSILTKSDLVVRDADLLGEFKEVDVGMTIITLDERVRRVFEAQAPPVSRRLAALAELAGRGLRIWAFVGPIIPYLSAPSLDELVRRLGETGVSHVFFDRLNLKSGNWPVIRRALQTAFADQYAAIQAALQPSSSYYGELREELDHLCRRHGVESEILF